MKSLLTYLALLDASRRQRPLAHAQYPFPIRPQPMYCPAPPLRAPDMCGPGFCIPNCYGGYYYPSYNVTPPFPPFQGVLPIPAGAAGHARFPSHPYVRSPRDFFMVD